MFKRFALFIGLNILIMVTVNLLLRVFGIDPSYYSNGSINYYGLAAFCLIWGMVGSFISLQLSKFMAKRFMGVEIVDGRGQYSQLVMKVHTFAKKAGLETMPEVGIYHSPELNAFATGPSKNNSLVAVSTGLLERMNEDEVDGVLAHEVAHIANGDMVTMALLQGVMNAFVMFAAKIVTILIDQALRGDDDEGRGLGFIAHIAVEIGLQIFFGILASIPLMWFSRYREYRADAGSARIAGKEKMISALEALQRNYDSLKGSETSLKTMQISSKTSFMELFSSHPPLERRINALRASM